MDICLIIDYLRPGAKYKSCATYAELEATWEDITPIPTLAEIQAAEADSIDAEKEKEAFNFSDIKKAFGSVLEITYENSPELQTAFPLVSDYKEAVKDRLKSKL